MNHDYLYHCAGCQKHDEEYPNKEIDCKECGGCGELTDSYGSTGDCWECGGYGRYTPRTPIAYHQWARNDAYGIYTGLYCDKCYKSNYPYKRGRYHDPGYCGESLDNDY